MSDRQSKVEEYLAKKQENKEFKDIGTRASGTAKEKRAYAKIVTLENLDEVEKNETEAYESVRKDKVFPKFDIEADKESGVAPSAAYCKIKLREAVQSQPPRNAISRKLYVGLISALIAKLKDVKTLKEFNQARTDFQDYGGQTIARLCLGDEEVDAHMQDVQYYQELMKELDDKKDEILKEESSSERTEKTNTVLTELNQLRGFKNVKEKDFQKKIAEMIPDSDIVYHWGLSDLCAAVVSLILGKRFYNILYNKKSAFYELEEEAKKFDGKSAEESEAEIKKIEETGYGKRLKEKKELLYNMDNIKSNEQLHDILSKGGYGFSGGDFRDFPAKKSGKYVYYNNILALKDRNPSAYYKYADFYLNRYKLAELERLPEIQNNYNDAIAAAQPREDDWSFAIPKKRGEQVSRTNLTVNKGKPLDHLTRVGGLDTTDIVDKATAKHYLVDVLGFKAVTLGATVTDELAKAHIRHFVGAMADMGEMLNMDVKTLNELHKGNINNGGLQFSVGAFMTKYAAFYNSGQVLINLTKKRGEGTIAHEYAHYIDSALCYIDNNSYILSADGSYSHASKSRSKKTYYGSLEKTCRVTNAAVCDRMIDIMNYIKYANIDAEERGSRPLKKMIVVDADNKGALVNGVTNQPTIEAAFEKLFQQYPRHRRWENLKKGDRDTIAGIVKHYGMKEYEVEFTTYHSNYFAMSSSMSSDYWSRDWELFARAQETYIYDKLQKAGRTNNYLVSGDFFDYPEGIYPVGDERAELFKLYDALYATMKAEYKIPDFKAWTDKRTDDYIIFEKLTKAEEDGDAEQPETGAEDDGDNETPVVEIVEPHTDDDNIIIAVDESEETLRETVRKKIKRFCAILVLVDETKMELGGRLLSIK